VINECFQKTAFTLDQCSSTGVLQNMQWGSVSFKGSVRVPRFWGEMIGVLLQYIGVIMKFFRSPYRIQTISRPVSYTGGN